MFRFVWFSLAALAFTGDAAEAIPISPGILYEGTFAIAPDNVQASSCCALLSLDGPFQFQQLNIEVGADGLDPGRAITLSVFDSQRRVLFETGWENLGDQPVHGFLGVGGPREDITSGYVQIVSSGGSFDLDGLEVQGQVAATVESIGGGTLATAIPFFAEVQNIAAVIDQESPISEPGVVPLPGSALLLAAGVAALGAARGRRRA